MAKFIQLDESFSVSAQITPADLEKVKAAGFTAVICNRPDNEGDGQPMAELVAAAARKLDLKFHYIPVGGMSFADGYVDDMAAALRVSEGKTLAYCRSGLRSALIWALASARGGKSSTKIVDQVETAGFPTRVIRTSLGLTSEPSRLSA